MKAFILFSTLIVASVALPMTKPGSMLDYQADSQIHKQQGTAGVAVEGEYSYDGPDGKSYQVKYRADDNGFVATGDHLPIAPEIAKAELSAPIASDEPAAEVSEEGAPKAALKTEAMAADELESISVVASDDSPAESLRPIAAADDAPTSSFAPFASVAPAFAFPPAFAFAPSFVPAPVPVFTQKDSTNYPASTGPLPEVKYVAPAFVPAPVIAPAPVAYSFPAHFPAFSPVAYSFADNGKAFDASSLPASTSPLALPTVKLFAPLL